MMRIAVVSHVRHPIAPPFMGGMEAHSWHLTAALVAAGHDVTLFASGDSAAALPAGAKLFPILPEHYDRCFPWHDFHGTDVLNAHVDAGFARAARALVDGNFDVIHNNALHRYPPRLARVHRLPMVTSLHIPPFDALRRAVHESAAPWARFTVTSHRQLQIWWPDGSPPEAAVVHNGIDPSDWPYVPGGDGSAVWAGRITPNKGTHLAARAAALAGVALTIYGTIEDQGYFDRDIAPLLGEAIRYGGHLQGHDLAAAYGRASVLLFTPCWEEPFGLAAIEAMATGLPVAAIGNGAAQEIIGHAGIYAAQDRPQDLATALLRALTIDPAIPHARVLAHYTLRHMIDGYEDQYAAAIAGAGRHDVPDVTFPPIELDVAPPPRQVVHA
ncbi:Glycosyltransferase involved in cell wall bisynthesis [Loktanella fryxellensis]|uniref:Glycosyltransferase involved in cell wall bisynthesis n=1 Tax=Loktanella fryxellensis TaxID=245187 RepID=A0A1H8HAF7_9RHOB|nr:glycosyltransferase [Loktanella fryxellensis]SEN52518.1 Glycosyltransferase involved in cell wall bisynthesis [Loktanella fryxellensis]